MGRHAGDRAPEDTLRPQIDVLATFSDVPYRPTMLDTPNPGMTQTSSERS
jgi:hypothetical protein